MNVPDKETQGSRKRCEVVLAGSGGQGLIVSAMLLGEGAVKEGKNVVQTQSYGIAARGGVSVAELIIDTEEIVFQQVHEPDAILALNEKALLQFAEFTGRGTLLFFDTTCGTARTGPNYWGFPFIQLASELGRPGVANLIALGAMVGRTGVIHMESLVAAAVDMFAKSAPENIEALRLGAGLVLSRDKEGHR